MLIITPDELIDYTAEPCPYCNECTLYIEFDEWEQDGTPTDVGVHVHCKNEKDVDDPEYDPRDHAYQPYVHWLPVDHRAHKWCLTHIRIADKDDRKELEAWLQGKPLPGGMG